MDPEISVLLGQLVQVVPQQNILLINVGENQVNLSLILWIIAHSSDNLEHGCDTSATGNHTESAAHVGSVHKLALGAADLDGLANLHGSHIAGNVTGRVCLDKQAEIAAVIVGRHGGVRPDYIFAVNVGAEGNVLTDREAEDVVGLRELELVAISRRALASSM